MYKIYKLNLSQPTAFAAEELKKYLRMMMPECGDIEITYDPKATDGFRLGLLEEFGLPNEAPDATLDDIVHIDTDENGGILAGSNQRSVLFAAYRFLKENGCRFLFPGNDGEFIPRKAIEPVKYHKMADSRFRVHTTEGDPSLDHALKYIDYQTKNEMNAYALYQIEHYHVRYYDHRFNEVNRQPEPISHELIEQWEALCQTELSKRGIPYYAGGHGWTAKTIGIDPKYRWEYRRGEMQLTEEQRERCAMLNGVRGLKPKAHDMTYTNFCLSKPELRSRFADIVVEYAEQNPHVAEISVTFADTSHNHCECEECQKKRPSDFYVMCLNKIDEKLTKKGLKTRIQPAAYVDCMFAPETERLKNPSRFTLLYCPIGRNYNVSIDLQSELPPLKEYIRNAWERPTRTEEYFAHVKQWMEQNPEMPVMCYEYHYWLHQYRDPGMMAIARRIFEDNRSLKAMKMDGCLEDGSNRSFFPNGFVDWIYGASLLDADLRFEDAVEDYFSHIYGKDWKLARNYLEKMSAAFDHNYMCGQRSVDPERGDFYNPEHVKSLEMVREIAAEGREFIKTHLAMPTRPQTVSWRLLMRHTEWCERFAEVMIEKCQGHDKYAMELFEKFAADFGKYDFETENYLDFGMAMSSLMNVVRVHPKK